MPLVPSSCAACSGGAGDVVSEVTVTGTVCVSDCGTPVSVIVENFPVAPLAPSVLLADALANPTVPQVGSHLMTYDPAGTYWNRVHSGPTLGSILVDQGPASWTVDGTLALDAPTLAALEATTVQNPGGAGAVNIQDGGNSITVDGAVSVSNLPAVQTVAGSVAVSNFPAFPAVQPVSGSVVVSNLPAVQPVNDGGGSLTVDGVVAVSNFPGVVAVSNLPAVQPINDNGGSLTVDGAVAVSNFPAFPVVQPINDNGGSLTVDGAVAVSNLPAVQAVSGSVAVTNLPAIQSVSGTVDLGAASLAALESVTVQNPAGAAAVNIQDGGNSITVDGTVELGATSLAALEAITVQNPGGAAAVNIQDGGNSITVDGAISVSNFPVIQTVALDAATLSALEYVNVSLDAPSLAALEFIDVSGSEAHDAPATAPPVLCAGRASSVAPAAVSADGDVTNFWTTRNGRQRVYSSGRRRVGVHYASLGSFTIALGADAAGVGRFYVLNPVGSTTVAAIRKIHYSMSTGTGLLVTTVPIVTLERITFVGTATGAAITPVKRDSLDAAPVLSIRTANTGIAVTTVGAMHGFQVPAALATASVALPEQAFPSGEDEDEWIILRAGEGVIVRQSTAGTNLDTRSCNFDITWEEYNATDLAIRD